MKILQGEGNVMSKNAQCTSTCTEHMNTYQKNITQTSTEHQQNDKKHHKIREKNCTTSQVLVTRVAERGGVDEVWMRCVYDF